jgi:hypothetical protein
MATLITLSGPDGPLTHVQVPLGIGVQPQRSFYACPEFMRGVEDDLPKWVTGKLNAAQTPQEQMRSILLRWISGREMVWERHFKDLMPMGTEAWEMKTADLRLFGWMYRPRVFIASFLGYADDYKGLKPKRHYSDAVQRVMTSRNSVDLDLPKFTSGEYDALV